jgi:hypothetical protein
MAQVTLKLYHSNGAAGDPSRELIETRRIETESAKVLTGKRAAHVIAREYPQFKRLGGGVGAIRTTEGWLARRALHPTTKCEYHYVWEEVVVYEG